LTATDESFELQAGVSQNRPRFRRFCHCDQRAAPIIRNFTLDGINIQEQLRPLGVSDYTPNNLLMSQVEEFTTTTKCRASSRSPVLASERGHAER